MNDNLNIFGKTYTGVTAITLTDINNQQQKFINTADANATTDDILSGKTAYVNGLKITGTYSGGTSYPEAAGNYFGTNLITFSVKPNGSSVITEYYALPEMTWGDFINSIYNSGDFDASSSIIRYRTYQALVYPNSGNQYVFTNESIIPNEQYTTASGSG